MKLQQYHLGRTPGNVVICCSCVLCIDINAVCVVRVPHKYVLYLD